MKMELTKKQFRKIEHLMPTPRKKGNDFKLRFYASITVHNSERLQMEDGSYWNQMKLKDIFSGLNVLEKFLPVMTNLILSILLLFILL